MARRFKSFELTPEVAGILDDIELGTRGEFIREAILDRAGKVRFELAAEQPSDGGGGTPKGGETGLVESGGVLHSEKSQTPPGSEDTPPPKVAEGDPQEAPEEEQGQPQADPSNPSDTDTDSSRIPGSSSKQSTPTDSSDSRLQRRLRRSRRPTDS